MCKHPDNAPTTGYAKGCRCDRCRAGAVAAQRAYQKRYPERNKAWQTKNRPARHRAYKQRNPLKHRAHWMVWNHLKLGNLVPGPCERCGSKRRKTQAHHEDYNKPLEVRWLCGPCHVKEHHP